MTDLTHADRVAGVAATFDLIADAYDNAGVPWFQPIAARLVAEAAPAIGERVVDMGCGRGAALLRLAEAVGPTGDVVGLDLSANMLAYARAEVRARGLAHVRLDVADVTTPNLPARGADLVTACLVVFFLPDPTAALRAWLDLLVPGGRLALATFGVRSEQWHLLETVFDPYLPQGMLDARTTGARGAFASDEGVEALVTDAGFAHARTAGFDMTAEFATPEQWYAFSRSTGQRAMWDAIPAERLAEVEADAAERIARGADADGVFRATQRIRFTLAERAE